MGVEAARRAGVWHPASTSTRCGSRRSRPRTSTRPTRPRCTRRSACRVRRLRTTRSARCDRRWARCGPGSRAMEPRWSSRPTSAAVCPAEPRKLAAATARPHCSSATGRSWRSWSRGTPRPRSSSTAGALRATCVRRCGRSGSARPATRAWVSKRGKAALKDAGLDADEIDHLIVTSTHERAAGAVAKKLGVAADRVVDGLAAPASATPVPRTRRCCSRPRSNAPGPARRSRSSCSPTAPMRSSCARPTRSRDQQPDRRRPGRRRRADRVRQVPRVARSPAGRAAAPARTRAPVGVGRRPRDRLEVRIRRFGE